MKKILISLLALSMLLSCFVGFSVNTAAEDVEYVEPTYDYLLSLLDGYGKVDEIEQNPVTGTYDSDEGFFIGKDERWMYEYYDMETGEFQPMTAYCKSKINGFEPGYSGMYVPYGEVGFSESGLTYCGIWTGGKYWHPGKTSGPVITFVVPATGTISFEATVTGGGAGDYLTLWVNETMVNPASGNMEDGMFTKAEPYTLSAPSIKVDEGDLVRLCLTTVGKNRSSKGSTIKSVVVNYIDSVLPIGNPNGIPPKNIVATPSGKGSVKTDLIWESALNAVSYNVYVKDAKSTEEAVKVNAEPITATSYKLEDLEFGTLYEITVTSITKDGKESVPSDPVGYMTPKGDGKTSDKDSDTSNSETTTNLPVTGNNNTNKGDNAGFPWIIVVIAAAVVVVVAIVLVLVLGKKKKAVAAPVAEETAEAAPVAAPAEEATEESPAEETKDEE